MLFRNSTSISIKEYKYERYHLKDNIDSMLDYLYWSYGDPTDLDNLIRRYFVKNAMVSYNCNCKEDWGNQC